MENPTHIVLIYDNPSSWGRTPDRNEKTPSDGGWFPVNLWIESVKFLAFGMDIIHIYIYIHTYIYIYIRCLLPLSIGFPSPPVSGELGMAYGSDLLHYSHYIPIVSSLYKPGWWFRPS